MRQTTPTIASARKVSPMIVRRLLTCTIRGLSPRSKSSLWIADGAIRKAVAAAEHSRHAK